MATLPTEEEAAEHVLDIFVNKFNCRPGYVLRVNNLMMSFSAAPWQMSDLENGLNAAADHGWIEILKGGSSFRLTELGYTSAGDGKMNLSKTCNELVTIERQDGSHIDNIKSLVTGDIVLIPDSSIPIEAGDAILRLLPSGLVDRLIVTDPGFYAKTMGIEPHYQVKYKKEGQKPEGNPGYVINNYGANSRTNLNSIDNSSNSVSYISQNLTVLADELTKLREALVQKASSADDFAAIGSIATAEKAAKAGDPSKVQQALSALGDGVSWVLGVAKDIGVSVAAETISNSI